MGLIPRSSLRLSVRFDPIPRSLLRGSSFGRLLLAPVSIFFLLILLTTLAAGQQLSPQEPSTEELVKQTQNPVADLISVPFQNNFNFGTGSKRSTVWVLNIQPVVPFHLSENWNLITRVITPVVNQPSLFPGMSSAIGLGDVNPTFFLGPAKPEEVIWAVGPTFTLPTATDRLLGSGKWSMGPAGVVVRMHGPWVYGALMNNQWSVAGWGDKAVNAILLQPFINYNLPNGWYLASLPILTANWKADKAGDVWTVPIGVGVGKLFKLGTQPVNTSLAVYGNVARPDFGSDWQLRFQIQFLFPK
jgi:hypothetical protein